MSSSTSQSKGALHGFPPPLCPSYEVLTLASVGLPPTEHISLFPFFWTCRSSNSPPRLYPSLRFTESRYQRKTRGRADR
jgi:hypothetical protein